VTDIAKPQADLKVRMISAAVMLAVVGWEVWMGGVFYQIFVVLIALGLIWEWWGLVSAIGQNGITRAGLLVVGIVYVGLACYALIMLRSTPRDLLAVMGCVIATDTGAYFAGRAIGGPKIAPRISPSKTWAGLGGGMLASAVFIVSLYEYLGNYSGAGWLLLGLFGAVLAIIAQAGDFLESGMKRRAGVKDSGHLIPGHGGLLDRVDGLLAVSVFMLLLSSAMATQVG
jgi:phosphatidate cytidylyltransferase